LPDETWKVRIPLLDERGATISISPEEISSQRNAGFLGWNDARGLDRLIPDVIRATYHHGKHVEIRNPDSVRPWQHVLEPLYGYLILAKDLYEGKTIVSGAWNFGPHNDSFVSVRALAEGASSILGKGGFIINPDSSKHEANLLKLDINKAVALLGWKPLFTFKETLELTFSWYKEYYENKGDMVSFTNKQIQDFLAHKHK
jgi:CDP-glucose 4,6-dehydratase